MICDKRREGAAAPRTGRNGHSGENAMGGEGDNVKEIPKRLEEAAAGMRGGAGRGAAAAMERGEQAGEAISGIQERSCQLSATTNRH